MLYPLIVLIVAAMAAVWGFRRGFARQTPAVIGMAFGIICTRLLAPGLNEVLYGAFTSVHGRPEQDFVYDTLSSALVFASVYAVFSTVTGFLGKVLKRSGRTILDNIGGALFALFKYMLFVSIAFNLLVAVNPHSQLVKSARSDDGNTVLEVMLLSPAVLGGEDIEDLSHLYQLEDAKKIS